MGNSYDLLSRYSERLILGKYYLAIGLLFRNDPFLLEEEADERSVSHKLAEYLQKLFPEWNVDCEYNLDIEDPKRLHEILERGEAREDGLVYPDIVVHIRHSKHNLLVVEIKTKGSDNTKDIRKLVGFTEATGQYKYKLGIFTKFYRLDKPEVIAFINGKKDDDLIQDMRT